jgi:shikimate kinase
MNIVLIGYRGTGKSSVGRMLATRLQRQLVSTDEEVVKRAGMSITEIVERHGWEYFRDLESAVCHDLASKDRLIIDTGGGAILRSQNVEALKKNGRVWWLTANVETISQRISHDTQRPSLTGTKSFIEEIRDVMTERLPKYRAAADSTIATEGLSVSEVTDRLIEQIRQAPC